MSEHEQSRLILQELDEFACTQYQREKEIGIRDRDSTALEVIVKIRELKKKLGVKS